MFLVLYVLFCLGWGLAATEMMDPFGKPIGYDFMAFWSASRVALDGAPLDAYDPTRLFLAQQGALPALTMPFLWHYPPTFYLAVLPLALLPYFWSYVVFTALTLGVYWGVVRRIVPQAGAGMLFLAFPGVFVNAFHGQNAFLTGALLGATLLLLERRPLLAGVCAGLLAIKPHLAVLLPIAFICMGAWRALFAAALTALVFLGVSVAVMGDGTLHAFISNLRLVRLIMESGWLPWIKMPTFFAFAKLLGAPTAFAYALQAIGALAVIACVAWIWRQAVDYRLKAAGLVSGTLLVSPYLFDYDLALLALPLAWYGMYGLRSGWRRGECEIVALCWTLPGLVAPLAKTDIQMAPFVLFLMLAMIVWRVQTDKRT
ncbi:MAG: DUF2029 domain-containing protein [Rhodocyclales bacterium]|nr:DUF2029 domain-containing protein [Rhodocyclales bacterium]